MKTIALALAAAVLAGCAIPLAITVDPSCDVMEPTEKLSPELKARVEQWADTLPPHLNAELGRFLDTVADNNAKLADPEVC